MAGPMLLQMFSRRLGNKSGGKRMPCIGYDIGAKIMFETIAHAYQCGYRHFLFEAYQTYQLLQLEQDISENVWIFKDDTFLTLKVPVTAHNKSSLEQNIAEVCSLLGRECIDNVLIYGNVESDEDITDWLHSWKEVEGLVCRGVVQHAGLASAHHHILQQISTHCTNQPSLLLVPFSADIHYKTEEKVALREKRKSLDKTRCNLFNRQDGLVIAVSLNQDRLMTEDRFHSCADHFPKSICRSLMDQGLPYIVQSTDHDFITKCFQVYDFCNK